jgi:hypothetical protein
VDHYPGLTSGSPSTGPPFKGDGRGALATMQGDDAKPTDLVPLGVSPSLEDSLVPLESGTP